MYNKLFKKHYLTKIFTLALPKKKKSNPTCYYLCKYFVQYTPYGNINIFIKEIYRIFSILLLFYKKNFLFICSNNIFLYTFLTNEKLKIKSLKNTSQYKKNFNRASSTVFLYNYTYNKKLFAQIKDEKILTVGFIDYHNQPNSTDYTVLLDNKFFSSIFLFHFILKKFIYHVKN